MKFCMNSSGHMTKMATTPYVVKTFKNFLLQNQKSIMILKLGMQFWGLKLYKVYINDVPVLTLIYFLTRSNLVTYAFECG